MATTEHICIENDRQAETENPRCLEIEPTQNVRSNDSPKQTWVWKSFFIVYQTILEAVLFSPLHSSLVVARSSFVGYVLCVLLVGCHFCCCLLPSLLDLRGKIFGAHIFKWGRLQSNAFKYSIRIEFRKNKNANDLKCDWQDIHKRWRSKCCRPIAGTYFDDDH